MNKFFLFLCVFFIKINTADSFLKTIIDLNKRLFLLPENHVIDPNNLKPTIDLLRKKSKENILDRNQKETIEKLIEHTKHTEHTKHPKRPEHPERTNLFINMRNLLNQKTT